jgi:GT2 family glycosyltransferase
MKYRFESLQVKKGTLRIQGWVIGDTIDSKALYDVTSNTHEPVSFHLERLIRNDVSYRFFQKSVPNKFGYVIEFPYEVGKTYLLSFSIEGNEKSFRVNEGFIKRQNNWISFKNGPFVTGILTKLHNRQDHVPDYEKWYAENMQLPEEELQEEKQKFWSNEAPSFSVAVPMYNTPEVYLRQLLDSWMSQTYKKFNLCIADASDIKESNRHVMEEYRRKGLDIRFKELKVNGGISSNTNEALKLADGDFVVMCDHDDIVTPDALFEFASAIEEDCECDLLYSDEDKIDESGKRLFDPHFKPDYNPDLLNSTNYISHLSAYRRTLIDQYGGLNSEYDGSQDYDFILRMTEQSRHIHHVPKILYHWRTAAGSTAGSSESKLYAFEAGPKALAAHYQRVYPELTVSSIEKGQSYGIYHTKYAVKKEPMISVIIANKDHIEDLNKVIVSMHEKNSWKNIEYIIVENNSTDSKTFGYYNYIQNEYSDVRVIKFTGSFNYSAINNLGAEQAKGEFLLFMNNDVELIEKNSLYEMAELLQRNDTGAVGCRLLYEDGTIQHAGVIIGIGVADHIFKNQLSEMTYFNRAMAVQDYSAVTAAVMMTKKNIFNKIGGFDETLAVAFNDVDYCLKVNSINERVVYTPYACFHHFESKSRGKDVSPEKHARYMQELSVFTDRWHEYYEKGDPFYNRNLSIEKTDCSIK